MRARLTWNNPPRYLWYLWAISKDLAFLYFFIEMGAQIYRLF